MLPFLLESEEQFTKHVSANPQVWYYYYQAAYLYIEKYGNTLEESTEQYTANQDNRKLHTIIDY
jgi:hypothetical protein